MSLRSRVTVFGLAVVLVVVAVLSAVVYGVIAGSFARSQDLELNRRLAEASGEVAKAPAAAFTPAPRLVGTHPSTSEDVVVLVADGDGGVLAGTEPDVARLPPEARSAVPSSGSAAVTATLDAVPVRFAVTRWERRDLGRSGVLAVGQALSRRTTALGGVVAALVVSAVVTLLAAGIGIRLVAGRALRPLRDLTVTADEVRRSPDRGRRLPAVARDDELGRLTGSFNGMLDRLEQEWRRTAVALEAQQRLAADASHELRTPLTTIRTNAVFLRDHLDAAPDDRAAAVADIEAEAARMSRLVDDLLTLARADGGARLARQPVDLAALAAQVCRRAATSHPDRRIVCTGPPVHLAGDADALQRLLGVLLDNAVRHTRDGGAVWVTVTSPAPGQAVLQVADDGEGIPPGQEERIFDRFHQADPSRRRGGAGLGLAIARWIAHEHGGWVTAGPTSGGGATFTVTLAPGPPVPGSSPA
jgi:signal transduction histidine kinase